MVVQLLYCHSIVGCYVFHELLAIKLCVISGKAYLWSEEKEPGAGEVQVCVGLQDKGTQETDRT